MMAISHALPTNTNSLFQVRVYFSELGASSLDPCVTIDVLNDAQVAAKLGASKPLLYAYSSAKHIEAICFGVDEENGLLQAPRGFE